MLKVKSKKESTSKLFPTQNETKNVCVINLDVNTCQVRCSWGSKGSESKTQGAADVLAS